jgi:gamma-glutamyltranspeptidase/glutathione hydrolase
MASAAGLTVLASGGNALDAAVAVNLTLGVVTPYLCGFGGDLFALVWQGGVHGYNGSGRAPAAATPEAVAEAAGSDTVPVTGPQSVTVPGAPEAWFALLERFGTRSFAELAAPALRYARDGFVLTQAAAASLERSRRRFGPGTEWWSVYGTAGEGDVLRQPGLARTIEALGTDGPAAYYRGPIAEAIAGHLRSLGGLMEVSDLAEHHGDWVEPLRAGYRDVEVLELPPNAQGVTALEALRIVERAGALPAPGPGREHLLLEATKLALADRDTYVADPAWMPIPAEALLADGWIEERFGMFDPLRARFPSPRPVADGGTAYLCAADADGMLVSLIQSNWMGFGSGVTLPEWGINLHNRGSLFVLAPEHPNAVGPRKRPLHTIIPGMALRDGGPWLAFGTMGGQGQAQTHLQLLARIVDDGLDIQEAIDAPRWTVSPATWEVAMESRWSPETVAELSRRGHQVVGAGSYDSLMGHAHAIMVDPAGYRATADPRCEGAALGL